MELHGVLLDSGDTVIAPRGGRWNPRCDFEMRLRQHWPDARVSRLEEAVSAGDAFLAASYGNPPYAQYYRVILDHLGITTPWDDEELLSVLLPPCRAVEIVDVFPDAIAALELLHSRSVPVVIVSDAWAGLEKMYVDLGIAHYFAGFVISEVIGCRKPDGRMYRAGSDLLGLAPEHCLFIDDYPPHVEAAVSFGYHGRVIDRRGAGPLGMSLHSLAEVVDLF
jgi:putative hydrolase of the HAD superfamily